MSSTIDPETGNYSKIDLAAGGAFGAGELDLTKSPTDKKMAAMDFKDSRELMELQDIIKDVLSGDPEAAKSEKYRYLNFNQIKTAIEWLMTNNFDEQMQSLLLSNPWLLTFKNKPPTPDEFLSHKYIGAMADSVWLPVRKMFIEYFDPLKPYRNAVLNPAIGSGKSTFTMLALLFVAASFSLMRDPWKFFNKSKTTVFAITLCAVTLTKAKEIYEEPIRQLIEGADFWRFCKTHKDMQDAEAELAASDTVEYIPWSNGGPQPLDSKVYLPDGSYKLMGDVKIGDKIASPTTRECTVVDIPYESSNDVCYEIELDDGRKCKCAAGHKWRVAWEKDKNNGWIWRVVPVEFLIAHPEIDFEVFEGRYTDEIRRLNKKGAIDEIYSI